jgi:stage III sporulation protein AE
MRDGVRVMAVGLCLLCLLLPGAALAQEDDSLTQGVSDWLDAVDWSVFETQIAKLPEEVRSLWTGLSMQTRAEKLALSGGEDSRDIWESTLLPALKNVLKSELKSLAGLFSGLMGLALCGGIAGALSGEGKGGLGGAAAFICRCLTLTTVLGGFAVGIKQAVEGTKVLAQGMEAVTPVLMTLLTALGATGTAGVFQPAMALLTGAVSTSMQRVIVPITVCGGVLGLVDLLTDRARLTEMSKLAKSVVKWMIGGVTALYSAATVLRGMTASALDSVTIRTAKYAAGTLFPAAGSLVTGSFDTALGCALLAKNALGTISILLCLSLVMAPLVHLAARMLLFRLAAAVSQPVAEKKQTEMLRLCADHLSVLLSAMAAAVAMFVVTLGLAAGLTGFGGGG